MSLYKKIIFNLPEVALPKDKVPIKKKLTWTFGILVLFFVLGLIPLFGVDASQASQFETLELILGAKIGKLLTLGIGPLVTSSIILQLLVGAGVLKFDTSTEEGKAVYTGTSKLLAYVFIVFEAIIYVKMGAIIPASVDLFWIVVFQLILGGVIVLYMDEVVKNWGFGSGISLFIAAGVAQAIFVQLLNPFAASGSLAFPFSSEVAVGKIFAGLYYISHQQLTDLLISVLIPIVITVGLFLLIVYFQSINVEIPLSFGRVRGQSMKWPLNFFYTSNIPVILIAALGANFTLWATLWGSFRGISMEQTWFYQYFVTYIQSVTIWDYVGSFSNFLSVLPNVLTYTVFMVGGSVMFGMFWVQTSGLDAKSQANKIVKSGLQIQGFRKDPRVIERLLKKYVKPLTIMGGIAVGLLAVFADIMGSLSSGTGLLLLIMIIYQMYQSLARESMEDFALLQKIFKK